MEARWRHPENCLHFFVETLLEQKARMEAPRFFVEIASIAFAETDVRQTNGWRQPPPF